MILLNKINTPCGCGAGPVPETVGKRQSGEAAIPASAPLAMAYIRVQPLDTMYPPEAALMRGTLYPDLDKPFEGLTVMGGGCR